MRLKSSKYGPKYMAQNWLIIQIRSPVQIE